MMKEFRPKKQIIEQKIRSKEIHERQEQERKARLYYQQHQEQQQKIQDHDEAMQNYLQTMNDLNQYIIQNGGDDEDSEYTHKLLFDFYKAQAICENMQKDEEQPQIYKRFVNEQNQQKNTIIKSNDGTTVFQQVKDSSSTIANSFRQMERRMTMKDKLQMGRFCSYDHIPGDNQIQQYQSRSSEEEILQRDALHDFFQKIKDKSEMGKLRYAQRKQRERQKKQSDKIAKMLRNTRYSQQYQQDWYEQQQQDEQLINRRKLKMQQHEKVRIKLKQQRQKRQKQKIKRQNKLNNTFQDSSNQVQFDSGESGDESDDENSQYQDSQQDLQNEYQQKFNHLDQYQDGQQYQDDYDYLSSPGFKSGKQKIIHGSEQYHMLKKNQKDKYFKKMYKQYEIQLRKYNQMRKKLKKQGKIQRGIPKSQKKSVSFSSSIYYKTFNSQAKPSDVKLSDEKQQVVMKPIWEYQDQSYGV